MAIGKSLTGSPKHPMCAGELKKVTTSGAGDRKLFVVSES